MFFVLFVSCAPVHQTQKLPDFLVEILSISSMQIAKSRRFNLMQFVHTVSVCGRGNREFHSAGAGDVSGVFDTAEPFAHFTRVCRTFDRAATDSISQICQHSPPSLHQQPTPPNHPHIRIHPLRAVCVCVFVSGH